MEGKKIILFDGQCALCSYLVRFIINRDSKKIFMFAPLASNSAKAILQKHGLSEIENDTIVLVSQEKVYLRAEAVFEIIKDLRGVYFLLGVFKVLPSSLNDFLYRLVAKNRHKLFSETPECIIPSSDIESRFLKDID